MNILVINTGSSSLKFQLIDMQTEKVIAKGNCERVTINNSFLKYKANGQETIINKEMPNHQSAMELVLKTLTDAQIGVISSLKEINAIGHRVVSGGDLLTESTVVTKEVLATLKQCVDFAPLHVPASILGVEACLSELPEVKNVLVFDTSFHSSMPEHAFHYGIPREYYDKYHIRRYGAHGTSHKFVSEEYFRITNKPVKGSKIISCHLGSGSSIAAIKNGYCVDTTMGFTPLEGLLMGTRCGDLDASVLEFLHKKTGMSLSEITNVLNKKSGIVGICGYSDMRDVEDRLDDAKCKLAFDIFCYRVRKYIGAYASAMEGVDAIIFTAGIGEKSDLVRADVLSHLEYLGVKAHGSNGTKLDNGCVKLSTEDSKVDVYIIPTNEELVIARETLNLTKK